MPSLLARLDNFADAASASQCLKLHPQEVTSNRELRIVDSDGNFVLSDVASSVAISVRLRRSILLRRNPLILWRSLRDSNPCYSLERAVS